jgi:hypothetical protein
MKNLLVIPFFCLLCYTGNSQWIWAKKFTNNIHSYGIKTAINSKGHFFILGIGGMSQGAQQIYQLDSDANFITQLQFPVNLTITDLKINSLDQVLITGSINDTITFGNTQFYSTGHAADIFIAAFDSSLQLIWGKVIGGKSPDAGRALVIDKSDRVFVYGTISDTVNFQGAIQNCNSNSNKFIACFSNTGQFNWVMKDSTDNTLDIDGMDMFINKNNELLVTGNFKQKNYYYFNGYSLSIPPLNSYDYGYHYCIKLDSNKNVLWGKCIKELKWGQYKFQGLSANDAYLLFNRHVGTDIDCKLELINNSGVSYTSWIPAKQIDNSVSALGVISDKPYFLHSGYYYDQSGARQENYLFTIENNNMVYYAPVINGKVYGCSLVKNHKGEYFLTGVFSSTITAGTLSLSGSSSIPFIAKFNLPALPTLLDQERYFNSDCTTYPNPSHGSFKIILPQLLNDNYQVSIYDILGKTIYSENFNGKGQSDISIGLIDRKSGVYFLEIISREHRYVKKIILEE